GSSVIGRWFEQGLVGNQVDGVEIINVDGTQAALFGPAQQVGLILVEYTERQTRIRHLVQLHKQTLDTVSFAYFVKQRFGRQHVIQRLFQQAEGVALFAGQVLTLCQSAASLARRLQQACHLLVQLVARALHVTAKGQHYDAQRKANPAVREVAQQLVDRLLRL